MKKLEVGQRCWYRSEQPSFRYMPCKVESFSLAGGEAKIKQLAGSHLVFLYTYRPDGSWKRFGKLKNGAFPLLFSLPEHSKDHTFPEKSNET